MTAEAQVQAPVERRSFLAGWELIVALALTFVMNLYITDKPLHQRGAHGVPDRG